MTAGFILKWLVLGALVAALGIGPGNEVSTESSDVAVVFEQKYNAWRTYLTEHNISGYSMPEPYIDNEPFREIVRLGVPALPCIAQKIREGDHFMTIAMARITGKRFAPEESLPYYEPVWRGTEAMWLDWWEKNKEQWLTSPPPATATEETAN